MRYVLLPPFRDSPFCLITDEYIYIEVASVAVNLETCISIFNLFHAPDPFLYPRKTSENQRLMFSGGIERDQRHEIC